MKKRFYFAFAILLCIAGQSFAQTSQEVKGYLPQVEAWTIDSEIGTFNRDNLYERINGAAPLFLENNFQEMTSMVYNRGEGEYITIQAYRHATPEDAFGMYASERSTDMEYLAIGGEAQGHESGLYFFAGCFYVQMSSSGKGEAFTSAMQSIGKGLAEKLDPASSYPAIFAKFPKDNEIPYSKAYITQNYIGHEFLKPAYTADYEIKGRKFQVFLIDGKTEKGTKKILGDYFAFTKQSGAVSEGKLLIKDKYNGNIPVILKGQYIIGAFDSNGKDFESSIYDFLGSF
ncbi:MAG: hypothetical protein LBS52_00625 [Dysgonamonadaceae bacterium]|jgi:hypothetical protein|nr:hypothetical protein [Dysgonamonadaceae bacterium]